MKSHGPRCATRWRLRARSAGSARALHRHDLAADGGLGRGRRHDRPLARRARNALRRVRRARAPRRLPRHVPSLRFGYRYHPTWRPRRPARGPRRAHRLRPAPRAARQRRCRPAGLEPRPAREHRRREDRQQARRLLVASAPAGPARVPRGTWSRQARAGCERAQEGSQAPQAVGRYRWLILAAGTLSATSLSAVQIGISAITPALRTRYGLSLSEIGIVLGATNAGMTLTLLAWGIVSDRIGERRAIVIGLTGSALSLA